MQPAVLIVDDDNGLRRMLRVCLALEFRVREAANGLEALRLIDADPPDVIVLDLSLPILSGHVVRREVAAQAHLRDIPIVVITGGLGPIPQDVSCTLRKPFDPADLVTAVRNCLSAGTDVAAT